MNREQQERRRALKARRRELDRAAEEIATAGKWARVEHGPSTRSKQAKRNYIVASQLVALRAAYDAMLAEMRELDRELGRSA